jgi:hypothetical protein
LIISATANFIGRLFKIKANTTMLIEQTKYTVFLTENEFEIRDYESYILAETIVEGEFDDAGERAFNRLYWFISGDNLPCEQNLRAMPISLRSKSEKIKMTSPVVLQSGAGNWSVSFMMPASYNLDSLPQPADYGITVRQVPARRMATVRYSSFWSLKSYLKNRLILETWIKKVGLTTSGDPVWARYSEPFTPWFLRRNEVMIPIN